MSGDRPPDTQSLHTPPWPGRRPPRRPTVGPFQATDVLGEGGMGIVYLAEQSGPIRRKVALKLIKAGLDSHEVVARFDRERQLLAMMEHPNIARVYEAGQTDDGRPYFVMEYVPGLPITRFCDTHTLPNAQRLELFTTVCEAVHHAHEKGLIHRDIKPSNILITGTPDRPVPKVIDFGVAKAVDQPLFDTFTTQTGQFVGTPAYMSPEQAGAASKDVDLRTDVYSLGVLLYELLVGVLPFRFSELAVPLLAEVQRMILEEDPIAPSTRLSTLGPESELVARNRRTDRRRLQKELRDDLDWIILKALEKSPAKRYATALALATDVQRHGRLEPVSAGPPSFGNRVRKFVRRRKRRLAVGGLGLALVGAIAVGAFSGLKARHAGRVAAREAVDRQFFEAQVSAHRDPEQAIRMLQALAEQAPEFLEPRIHLANLLHRENRIDESAAVAEDLLADAPDYGPAHLLLARIYEHRKPDLAERHLREGRRLLPADRYYQALAMPAEQSAEAVALLSEILDSDGTNFEARWSRAVRYMALRDYESMLADAEYLRESRRDAAAVWNLRGIALALVGRTDEAIASYTRSLELTSDHASTLLNRAMSYMDKRHPTRALADCKRAVRLEPERADAWAIRAVALIGMGQLASAEADVKKALTINPRCADAHWAQALILTQGGKLHAALDELNRAIEIEPRNRTFRTDRAWVFSRLGRHDEARADASVWVELEPESAHAYDARARAALGLGSLELAVRDFDRALELRPDFAQSYNNRARAYRLMGDYEQALKDNDRAVKLAPPDARHPRVSRGITRWLSGDIPGAVADFEVVRASTQDPGVSFAVALWLWQIHASRGDTSAADAALQKAEAVAQSPWQKRLVGLVREPASPEALIADAVDRSARSEALYHLGALADVDGRRSEAQRWYSQCVALGSRSAAEHDLSLGHLRRMRAQMESADEAAADQ